MSSTFYIIDSKVSKNSSTYVFMGQFFEKFDKISDFIIQTSSKRILTYKCESEFLGNFLEIVWEFFGGSLETFWVLFGNVWLGGSDLGILVGFFGNL